MGVTIFAMTHKKFPMPKDTIYVPLHVGKACAAALGYMGDDTGVNISEKNCYYGELTGVYWVWKNFRTSDYVGICHYRRYFCTEEGRILTGPEYEKILSEYDMITSKKLKLNFSYYEGYAGDYNEHDLVVTGKVIREKFPEYYETFERLVHQRGTYFGNMMVCKKELYDKYCEWLFAIFEEAENDIDASGYDDYHKRVYGFISEFLLMVFAEVNTLKVYECKVGMTDEKRETAEIKDRMAEFFLQKDIAGAKEYILRQLEKRPDVLMEASDITGELKMSMQVIAVCELEQAAYGSSVIDRYNRFDELMTYFRELNEILNDRIAEERLTEQENKHVENHQVNVFDGGDTEMCREKRFFAQYMVSDIAVRASARLYTTPEQADMIADNLSSYCKYGKI